MELTEQELEKIREYFKEQPVLNAYLFGSYARGEADADSDIDLLVDLDYSTQIGYKFFGMHQDLQRLLQRKVDVVPSDGVSRHLRPFIEKDKKLIYAK
ncbi:nucleotidyltransferase family protein [Rufibacter glacialis]|uniref:Nucleotidyltransferase n=1 Tax=Rufibacter glacialis TaxID=1259555 RepID=A0A5M8QLN7_9BACT|nr:nucleotidyltransferase domain-containing protein [Rufibacter glacialis]KAA6437137.1 nucleotidyltransferase [Rufibacter glacialis]GGK61822.1 DNA polymerase subunit beta [Rufibacter glacialis]